MALILHAATYCRILHSGSRLCRLPSPRLLNASHRLPSRGRRGGHFPAENSGYRRLIPASASRLGQLPSPRLLNASHRLPSRGRRAEHFQPENAVYRRLTRGPALNSFLSYRCLSSVYPRSSAAKLLFPASAAASTSGTGATSSRYKNFVSCRTGVGAAVFAHGDSRAPIYDSGRTQMRSKSTSAGLIVIEIQESKI